ncbi:hypothetical protein [Streptomyces scopuliridis]|uniref:Uncharacterized protein n=1 Tax=Streptomyces scopuliridis TaxID=452529 RepID=A0ACD4ZZA0_9ACTN|nr:hypothetical protein [Streptomyces scopuliridis]WSC03589.1 hypothetical protein OG835_42615 [Streptomyces scopuliridis]
MDRISATKVGASSASSYISIAAIAAFLTDDIDEIAVERAVNGERPSSMTTGERVAAARVLDGRGVAITVIAQQVGANPRTVETWKLNQWDPEGSLRPVKRVREVAPCPSAAAYKRHLARGETPCPGDRAANTAADRDRRAGRRAASALDQPKPSPAPSGPVRLPLPKREPGKHIDAAPTTLALAG